MLSRSLLLAREDAMMVFSRAASSASKSSAPRMKTFEIYRFDPDQPNAKPQMKLVQQVQLNGSREPYKAKIED
ncbi:hypothetical protein NECAME_12688 [Necator americanus]|uniref:Uncharacterized protein n=1 Tax=Necator americanus TaxID=51031 RepID=W2SZ38_NECAM|nr:hypothetical protein NECAME_12688 [Necator americanus]ETN74848.1 hypothetical protein NECAME_12688 [Necator americanus]